MNLHPLVGLGIVDEDRAMRVPIGNVADARHDQLGALRILALKHRVLHGNGVLTVQSAADLELTISWVAGVHPRVGWCLAQDAHPLVHALTLDEVDLDSHVLAPIVDEQASMAAPDV